MVRETSREDLYDLTSGTTGKFKVSHIMQAHSLFVKCSMLLMPYHSFSSLLLRGWRTNGNGTHRRWHSNQFILHLWSANVSDDGRSGLRTSAIHSESQWADCVQCRALHCRHERCDQIPEQRQHSLQRLPRRNLVVQAYRNYESTDVIKRKGRPDKRDYLIPSRRDGGSVKVSDSSHANQGSTRI